MNVPYVRILVPTSVVVAAMIFTGGNLSEATPQTSMRSKASGGSGSLVVVELYQSQGCSSCPPANEALNTIAGRSDILALSFAVTYWDRLGWKDIFGDPAYTKRQYAYASALGNSGVYTPQVVLNGRRAIVGNRPGELERAISATRPLNGGPSIDFKSGAVAIGEGKSNGDVLLIRYDPRNNEVSIHAGENGGRKLPHRNIVRQLVKLGKWDGNSVTYKLPDAPNVIWQSAILVQSKKTGAILAARKL